MAVVAFNHLKSLALKVKAEIAEVANAAADALEELEAQKPDKAQEVSATIPVTGWSADTNAYPNYYDLTAAGVTEHDISIHALLAESDSKSAQNSGVLLRI